MSEVQITGSLEATSNLSVTASRQRSISGSAGVVGSLSASVLRQRLISGSVDAAGNLSARASCSYQSCFIFMTDAALEKCRRHPFQVDLIISPSRYPPLNRAPKTWGTQYAEPDRRMAF